MELDSGTLVATVVVVLTLLSGLLALTWAQNRGVAGLGIWSICFVLCAGAAALWSARGSIPDFLAFDLANAMRLSAFGLGWRAARQFAGRQGAWTLVLAPAALWLIASQLTSAPDGTEAVVLSSWLIGSYALAIAAELWRGSHSGLRMARPAAILLTIHGTFFLGRALTCLILGDSYLSLGLGAPVHPFVMFEALVVAVALAFLLVSAAKEQLEVRHREAAHIDPLTGIANRRGFDAAVEQMLSRARRDGSSTALLALDLDHFKAVNDTWGHQVGDFVLRSVAQCIERELRGGDIAARLGGEEFAVALAGSRIDLAAIVAERIRRAVAALDIRRGDEAIRLSVSIGVAALRDAPSLDALCALADAALYRAKAGGRNRVEFAAALLAVAEPDQPQPLAASRAA